jgi:hypothetical protein
LLGTVDRILQQHGPVSGADNFSGLVTFRGTDRENKNATQDACHDDENPTRKEHNEANLFARPQRGLPQHGNWNAHEVNIGQDVQYNCDKNVNSGDGWLAGVYVWSATRPVIV